MYYADKRVKHDEIVSLEERLEYLIRRYGQSMEHPIPLLREGFDLWKAVENKLFTRLDFGPEDLAKMVK